MKLKAITTVIVTECFVRKIGELLRFYYDTYHDNYRIIMAIDLVIIKS